MSQKKPNYIKIGIFAALAFLLIISFATFLFSLNSGESTEIILGKIVSANFMIPRIIMASVYGFFLVYMLKKKAKKLNRK